MSRNDNEQLNTETEQTTVEEQPIEAAKAEQPVKSKISKFWDILLWVLIVLLAAAVLVRAFVFTRVTISGDSMNPTYKDGEIVRVVKLGKPKRGDVVVFYKNEVDSKFKAMFAKGADIQSGGKYEKLIKRVVAVEGDSIWIEPIAGGYQLVVKTSEGKILHEDYYKKGKELLSADTFVLPNTGVGLGELKNNVGEENALVIEKDHFFAMGDNRGNSEDSRGVLGQVNLSQLFGIVR